MATPDARTCLWPVETENAAERDEKGTGSRAKRQQCQTLDVAAFMVG